MRDETRAMVRDYYGKTLNESADLKTSACCSPDAAPFYLRPILSQIEDEVQSKFYGCGSRIPVELEGCNVLDLGCGTGRDAFVLSKLVGPRGAVVGVDMTDEQIAVAERNIQAHMSKFGFQEPNVRFLHGYIEDLTELGLADNSFDIVISNCVINLSADKEQVFREVFRVLKPGGELYFSDVFCDRRIPQALLNDAILRGECLSGALYFEDFRRLLCDLGCPDFRVMSQNGIELSDPSIQDAIGGMNFSSVTVRAFKLPSLEDRCEDYGQVATYLGTISECPNEFVFDNHHRFIAHKPMLVCGNTASMLTETRVNKHFDVQGNRERHFGLFDCTEPDTTTSAACC